MSLPAGSLLHRIDIEQRVPGQDPAGQPVDTWDLVAAVWADIRYETGISTIRAGADTSVARVSIRIRYRTGIHAGMRVRHGSTYFDIKQPLPDLAGREHVDLVCEVINVVV